MAVTQKWCLEDIILPFELRSLDLCSWSGSRAQSLKEDCGFLLLNLGGRSAHQWLSRYFRQPKRWWWSLSGTSQVIKDILSQYPSSSSSSTVRRIAGASRGVAGLTRNVVVPIVVRGKEILVLNDRRSVTLAFEEAAAEFENLHWFLNELRLEIEQDKTEDNKEDTKQDKKKDKKKDMKKDMNEDIKEDMKEDMSEDEEEDEGSEREYEAQIIDQALETIKAMPGCKSACWLQTARRFGIKNLDGVERRWSVPRKSRLLKNKSASSSLSEELQTFLRTKVFIEVGTLLEGSLVSTPAAP